MGAFSLCLSCRRLCTRLAGRRAVCPWISDLRHFSLWKRPLVPCIHVACEEPIFRLRDRRHPLRRSDWELLPIRRAGGELDFVSSSQRNTTDRPHYNLLAPCSIGNRSPRLSPARSPTDLIYSPDRSTRLTEVFGILSLVIPPNRFYCSSSVTLGPSVSIGGGARLKPPHSFCRNDSVYSLWPLQRVQLGIRGLLQTCSAIFCRNYRRCEFSILRIIGKTNTLYCPNPKSEM